MALTTLCGTRLTRLHRLTGLATKVTTTGVGTRLHRLTRLATEVATARVGTRLTRLALRRKVGRGLLSARARAVGRLHRSRVTATGGLTGPEGGVGPRLVRASEVRTLTRSLSGVTVRRGVGRGTGRAGTCHTDTGRGRTVAGSPVGAPGGVDDVVVLVVDIAPSGRLVTGEAGTVVSATIGTAITTSKTGTTIGATIGTAVTTGKTGTTVSAAIGTAVTTGKTGTTVSAAIGTPVATQGRATCGRLVRVAVTPHAGAAIGTVVSAVVGVAVRCRVGTRTGNTGTRCSGTSHRGTAPGAAVTLVHRATVDGLSAPARGHVRVLGVGSPQRLRVLLLGALGLGALGTGLLLEALGLDPTLLGGGGLLVGLRLATLRLGRRALCLSGCRAGVRVGRGGGRLALTDLPLLLRCLGAHALGLRAVTLCLLLLRPLEEHPQEPEEQKHHDHGDDDPDPLVVHLSFLLCGGDRGHGRSGVHAMGIRASRPLERRRRFVRGPASRDHRGHKRTPRVPGRARLPLLHSCPGGVR